MGKFKKAVTEQGAHVVDVFNVCTDCIMVLEGQTDTIDADREGEIMAAIKTHTDAGHTLHAGECVTDYASMPCRLCGSQLHGARHSVTVLSPAALQASSEAGEISQGPRKKQAIEAAAWLQANGYTIDYSEGVLMGISKRGGPNYSIRDLTAGKVPAKIAHSMEAIDAYDGDATETAFNTVVAGLAIELAQTSPTTYLVRYGAQIDEDLDYHDAASAIGSAIMHALTIEGKVQKDESLNPYK